MCMRRRWEMDDKVAGTERELVHRIHRGGHIQVQWRDEHSNRVRHVEGVGRHNLYIRVCGKPTDLRSSRTSQWRSCVMGLLRGGLWALIVIAQFVVEMELVDNFVVLVDRSEVLVDWSEVLVDKSELVVDPKFDLVVDNFGMLVP